MFVRIRRVQQGVLLEPLTSDVNVWFDELDRMNSEPFPAADRNQPRAPKRDLFR